LENKLRIEFVVSEINNGKLEFLTIEGLATSSGFASRSNFNKAFFTIMNQTPTEYIKGLKNKRHQTKSNALLRFYLYRIRIIRDLIRKPVFDWQADPLSPVDKS